MARGGWNDPSKLKQRLRTRDSASGCGAIGRAYRSSAGDLFNKRVLAVAPCPSLRAAGRGDVGNRNRIKGCEDRGDASFETGTVKSLSGPSIRCDMTLYTKARVRPNEDRAAAAARSPQRGPVSPFDRNRSSLPSRSMIVCTIFVGVASTSTVRTSGSPDGGSSVANWLSRREEGMK